MTIKGYKLEQIVTLLRQIEVEMADGKTPRHAYGVGAETCGPVLSSACLTYRATAPVP